MAANPNSILDSVKKTLGFDPEFTAFDLDVVLFTNASFGYLRQLGVGSDDGFIINDNTTLWSQYVVSLKLLGMVKQYIFMYVKLAFDPPATSFGIDALKYQIDQLGWRINVAAEEDNPPSDPFGRESTVVQYIPKVVNLTFSSTVNLDTRLGNVFYLDMAGDCTVDAPVNARDGEHITFEIVSNGHSITWGNGWDFGDAGTPSLSADKADIVSAYYRASATSWRAGFTSGF